MSKQVINGLIGSILGVLTAFSCVAQDMPGLILNAEGVEQMRAHTQDAPLFSASIEKVRKEVDAFMAEGVVVPVPKDLAGGYTHEQHKQNFFMLRKAGILFQLSQEEHYAQWITEVLQAYRAMYQDLSLHPAERSYARGKIFWQCLNDANWLVYVSQAYDCIYPWLSEEERQRFNDELFRPMAEFLSVQNPKFFNRIHNHSTWGNAAVGMIALVMDDEELLQRALYGLQFEGPMEASIDNDGGAIDLSAQAGFLAQIDHAFSPDGYYTEGPYYQRYAMYPFLIFAQALQNKRPDLGIFKYRDGVLIKGVYALLNQTDGAGRFFPLNDAQKGMSYYSRELTTCLTTAYYFGNRDAQLLSLINAQGRCSLDHMGLAAALDIAEGKAKPFIKKSVELTDGARGDEGALGILRTYDKGRELALVMKYAKHGMGHGHFDRLSFSLYDQDLEVIQDYGAARWVNIEQKDGGGYLKENKTWAKQTVAHNTVVLNRKSQFSANVKAADAIAPEAVFFDASNPELQVMSARSAHAYPGTEMQRTMVLINSDELPYPTILDLYQIIGNGKSDLELPFWFQGDLLKSSAGFQANNSLEPMGEDYGYQHLWEEAQGRGEGNTMHFSWFNQSRFYSLCTARNEGDTYSVIRLGANDPNFNLRRDAALVVNRSMEGATLFANSIELHGSYSPVTELSKAAEGAIKTVKVLYNDKDYSAVELSTAEGHRYVFAFSNSNQNKTQEHNIRIGGDTWKWEGPYLFKKIQ